MTEAQLLCFEVTYRGRGGLDYFVYVTAESFEEASAKAKVNVAYPEKIGNIKLLGKGIP